jgi:hypothetical protein
MTVRKREIEKSLAERGRPAMWANEQEAAVLSGVTGDAFRRKVKEWERRGFPPVNRENGKRPIPGILAFWGLPMGWAIGAVATLPELSAEEDEGLECWPSASSPTGYVDQHNRPRPAPLQPGRWGATHEEVHGKRPRRPR